jgi:hypothetical protein
MNARDGDSEILRQKKICGDQEGRESQETGCRGPEKIKDTPPLLQARTHLPGHDHRLFILSNVLPEKEKEENSRLGHCHQHPLLMYLFHSREAGATIDKPHACWTVARTNTEKAKIVLFSAKGFRMPAC